MKHLDDRLVAKQPTSADYNDGYFTTLYGKIPRQTMIDRVRDRLISGLVLRHSNGGRLLEIGCGFGYLLSSFARLSSQTWRLHGSDISTRATTVARRRLPDAHIVTSDVQQGIPFRGHFDILIAVNVMEHLPDPAVAAEIIAAALHRGSIFIAHLPTISSPLSRHIYARTYDSDPTHVYRPSGTEFNRLIERAGFETLHSLYCPFWPAALWRRLKPHPAYLAVFRRT